MFFQLSENKCKNLRREFHSSSKIKSEKNCHDCKRNVQNFLERIDRKEGEKKKEEEVEESIC